MTNFRQFGGENRLPLPSFCRGFTNQTFICYTICYTKGYQPVGSAARKERECHAETGKAISRTIYKFDIYRIPTIYRDNLEKELSTAKGYKTWINFAKEQYAKQIVDIPDVDRISALEQAIMEIGEVLGNG